MDHAQHNQIVNFIWGIADDVLRDYYVRGKYRDVTLPMVVIRRLDVLLESSKDAVLKMKETLDKANVVNQDGALRQAAGQPFYNASAFTLKKLLSSPKQLKADFVAYLDGFSANVQEIIRRFRFREQVDKLAENDLLGHLIEKFIDPDINLGPKPASGKKGQPLPPLDNHGMGYVFEELIRRFNEENNEEAGEHFTPREVVRLMAKLIFLPVADKIESNTYLVYDGACGTGGMLTVAEETLTELAAEHGKDVSIHLFGQEVNDETYAITRADLLLKGEGEGSENIRHGSTLSADGFPRHEFDFMLSNPPYGKSWKTDLERLCGGNKKDLKDSRFLFDHDGDAEFSLVTRSSDGQLMFLANMLSKMKKASPLGSRIAEVHNGSSLFTGDAGQGESNIRRWIIENDWLEAIVALPLNIFYNTGIATYIWVLSNRKADGRKGKVQLIDASNWFVKLDRNLGRKNCELTEAHIGRICDAFLKFENSDCSKVFPNEEFGYRKVTVERPLRWSSQFTKAAVESLRFASGNHDLRRELYDRFGVKLYDEFDTVRPEAEAFLSGSGDETGEEADEDATPARKVSDKVKKKLLDAKTWERDHGLVKDARALAEKVGEDRYDDHNTFRAKVDAAAEELGLGLSAADRKAILAAVSWRNPDAVAVVKKRSKPKRGQSLPQDATLYGTFVVKDGDGEFWVEYEPDPELRDAENVPLAEEVNAFFEREVKPHVPDAWMDRDSITVGYEIPFTRYFYRFQPLRPLTAIADDLRKLEKEAEGLLEQIAVAAGGDR